MMWKKAASHEGGEGLEAGIPSFAAVRRAVDVFKKKGMENPADLGTKFLDGNRVLEICKELGFCIMHGVSKLQKGLQ